MCARLCRRHRLRPSGVGHHQTGEFDLDDGTGSQGRVAGLTEGADLTERASRWPEDAWRGDWHESGASRRRRRYLAPLARWRRIEFGMVADRSPKQQIARRYWDLAETVARGTHQTVFGGRGTQLRQMRSAGALSRDQEPAGLRRSRHTVCQPRAAVYRADRDRLRAIQRRQSGGRHANRNTKLTVIGAACRARRYPAIRRSRHCRRSTSCATDHRALNAPATAGGAVTAPAGRGWVSPLIPSRPPRMAARRRRNSCRTDLPRPTPRRKRGNLG